MRTKTYWRESTAPGTTIVGFSESIQLYDATYFMFSMGKWSSVVGQAGAGIIPRLLVMSRPCLRSGSGGRVKGGSGGGGTTPPAEVEPVSEVWPETTATSTCVGNVASRCFDVGCRPSSCRYTVVAPCPSCRCSCRIWKQVCWSDLLFFFFFFFFESIFVRLGAIYPT
jgi:hypothetical protein